VHIKTKQISSVVQEFSRFAHQYEMYNVIQVEVATTLVSKLPNKFYKNIIDIGAGNGEIYKNLKKQKVSFVTLTVLDSAEEMLAIHPKQNNILKICTNFNSKNLLSDIPLAYYDLLISSSALQWSTDLEYTMKELSSIANIFYGAVFTSGTFKTLHDVAKVNSPIYTPKEIKAVIKQHYNKAIFHTQNYKLKFKSTRDMFRYIKQSGVSSGERKLNYCQTKKLMDEYPLDYLEFEVLFIEAKN